MRKKISFVILFISLMSCGTNQPQNMTENKQETLDSTSQEQSKSSNSDSDIITENEKAVLDTLQKQFKCEISVGSTKDILRLKKPYDFEIILSNIEFNKDSLGYLAQYVGKKYYPYLNNKER